MKHFTILLLLCLPVCSTYPLNGGAKKEEDPNLDLLQHYLENYYNLAKDVKQFVRRKDSGPVVKKIQEMQKFLGLEVTGKLDSETLEVMRMPRCGVPDVGDFGTFPSMPKWRKTRLTYRIVNYTLDLPRDAVDSAIEKALKVWEEVTPLTFSRIYEGEADILITFAAREHGDFIPFDGPGMVLAHAFSPGPGINGDAHFDDDEKWTKDTSGPPPASPDDPVVPTESVPPETPAMCDPTLSFDAVSTLRGEILFFKDRYFWRRSLWRPEPELHLISTFWPSLPSHLDAAYEVPSKDTIFIFKGNKFWAIRGTEVQAGYPRDIHTLGFPSIIRKIDAAVSDEEKKTYFFVEDKYWRFDENSQSMEQGFPRLITDDFPGVEPKANAVLQAFGFFYFFSGSSKFEFDPNVRMVTRILKSNYWLCGQRR
ncbi:stromelysin-1 isoform X5 [Pteropus medius]|uniref:stromelysin-1 isoform X5 n=1 Tax=Pteropus vampyrus TaxID=132908 RepID=UPI00196B2179|nr:stromelysin-1 isoform X5 [Pteropus giganteus]